MREVQGASTANEECTYDPPLCTDVGRRAYTDSNASAHAGFVRVNPASMFGNRKQQSKRKHD